MREKEKGKKVIAVFVSDREAKIVFCACVCVYVPMSKSRGLKLKGTRGPNENKIFELCVKNQCIWENKENNSIYPFKSSFF